MQILLVLIALVVIGAVVWVSHQMAEARRRELAACARERGWSFAPERDRDMDDRYSGFSCLKRGHSRYAHNVMKGERDGLPVTAFDYHYVTGHGKNRQTHRFSALIVRSPLPLRPLFIRPENFFDKLTEFVGLDDIDFESAEFSRKFYVKAQDRRWAYDVIHPRMMEYLMQAPRFSLQFDGDNIIAWRGRRFSGPDFDEACGVVRGMLDRLPEYLKQQQDGT
jgi:hypothetical protein